METPKLTEIVIKAKELGIKPDEINIHFSQFKGWFIKSKIKNKQIKKLKTFTKKLNNGKQVAK